MEQTTEKKIEAISCTVATQVATQLTEVIQHYAFPIQNGQKQTNQQTPTKNTQECTPEWKATNIPWEMRSSEMKTNEDIFQVEHKEGDRK